MAAFRRTHVYLPNPSDREFTPFQDRFNSRREPVQSVKEGRISSKVQTRGGDTHRVLNKNLIPATGPNWPPQEGDGLYSDRRDPSGSKPRRDSSRTHPNDGHLGIY